MHKDHRTPRCTTLSPKQAPAPTPHINGKWMRFNVKGVRFCFRTLVCTGPVFSDVTMEVEAGLGQGKATRTSEGSQNPYVSTLVMSLYVSAVPLAPIHHNPPRPTS